MNSNNPNTKTDKMESYYEQSTYQTIEKAELAETVTSDGFKEVKGKFFLKVMTPSLDTNEVETVRGSQLAAGYRIRLQEPRTSILIKYHRK